MLATLSTDRESTVTCASNPVYTLPPDGSTPRVPVGVAERKLQLLRRMGLFGNDLNGAEIVRASSFEELRGAYKLVHDTYVESGYIKPEPAGLRLRIFETSSRTATFIARKDDRVVGVLSVVTDIDGQGLPSDEAFRPELNGLRAQGLLLCELTNQAVAPEFRRSAVPTELMRCAVAYAIRAGFDESIAAVGPSHNGFYDLMGFRQVGSERSYSQKIHDPVVALSMDLNLYRDELPPTTPAENFVYRYATTENPHIVNFERWDREARAAFLSTDLLAKLFAGERDFLGECTPSQLESIRRRWGHELMDDVQHLRMITLRQKRAAARRADQARTARRMPSEISEVSPDWWLREIMVRMMGIKRAPQASLEAAVAAVAAADSQAA